jgi:periplasmic protein TonB
MDQWLFRNRNQAYGAYRLRRQYPAVLFWSAIITMLVFILLMLLLFNESRNTRSAKEEIWYFFDSGGPEGLNRPPKKKQEPASGAPDIRQFVPQVSDAAETADTLVNPAEGNGPDTTGSGLGQGNGQGEGPLYYSVQQAPSFPGGEKERIRFLQQNINYPPEARKNKIRGTVYVSFIVEADGSISNVRLMKGIGYGCDEEALRVISSMPRWTAGRQNGIAVRVHMVVPLVFTLN